MFEKKSEFGARVILICFVCLFNEIEQDCHLYNKFQMASGQGSYWLNKTDIVYLELVISIFKLTMLSPSLAVKVVSHQARYRKYHYKLVILLKDLALSSGNI